jgi:hypothetical protein
VSHKLWIVIGLAASACSAGDDVTDGARAECAQGGTLEMCPEADRTAEGACWKLVDCAVIPVRNTGTGNNAGYDWGDCVNDIEKLTDDRQRLVIDCLAVATCDSQKVDGSPDHPNQNEIPCFAIGGL